MDISQSGRVYTELCRLYPNRTTELTYKSVYELYVSVLLSSQCTDRRVNMVTPSFFRRFPDFAVLSKGPIDDIIDMIRSCGLYRTKGRNLFNGARIVIEKFGGELPRTRPELELLPGIGRKSASVILCVGFGIPAFPVDTHISRLCYRLGWSPNRNPRMVERMVTSHFDEDTWHDLHHAMIRHGREVCSARRPQCARCPLLPACPQIGLIEKHIENR